MSERKPSAYINDILKCISHIDKYTSAINFNEFAADFMVVEACLYNFQIMGEAVSHLPDEFKQKEAHIPWSLIKGCVTGSFMSILERTFRWFGIRLRMIFHP